MAHTKQKRRQKRIPSGTMLQPHIIMLGALCVIASFSLGIRTAGDVRTVSSTNAAENIVAGDMNGDERLTVQDAILILEIVQGYAPATVEQLRRDPSGDGKLTVDDAVSILHELAAS